MAGPRHRARELALKVLFQLEHRPDDDPEAVLAYHAGDDGASSHVRDFAGQLVRGVVANREALDETIQAASTNWRLDQMGRVDRVVLRMAVYEIDVARQVPVGAAINESIELAKTFSGDESGRFVNGILGKVAATGPSG
jgi:N utilization substance protein B